MLEILSLDADNVIGCVIDGKINAEDIEKISKEIDDKLKTHKKLRVYVEVKNLGGISLDAFFEDLKLGFRHFKNFDKKAVVTDKGWMMKVAPIVDKIFSSIEVKCFSFEDKDEAVKWVKS
jgi:hypothetical protein